MSSPPVDVYWNSHRRLFSVRSRGRVIDHQASLLLADARFIVNPRVRDRVRLTKKKEVHAIIRGYPLVSTVSLPAADATIVSYNPMRDDQFVDRTTGQPIFVAKQAHLHIVNNRPVVCTSA